MIITDTFESKSSSATYAAQFRHRQPDRIVQLPCAACARDSHRSIYRRKHGLED